jgi:hypothetical protein
VLWMSLRGDVDGGVSESAIRGVTVGVMFA